MWDDWRIWIAWAVGIVAGYLFGYVGDVLEDRAKEREEGEEGR